MTLHGCEKCGAENASNAEFCTTCDHYLGWDAGVTTLDDTPLTTAIPMPGLAATEKFQTPRSSPPPPRRPVQPAPAISLPRTGQVSAPELRLGSAQVNLDPVRGATFDLTVRNVSSVPDGYTVTALNAPDWLVLEHPKMSLPASREHPFTVTLAVPPHLARTVAVQRIRVRLQVCSVEHPSKRSGVELIVVIPRSGPPATMSADPLFIGLRDATSGEFRVRLDNRASNYPQRFELSGRDPEGVVRFIFRPPIVEVPPAGVQSVDVRFEVPAPRPGTPLTRALTVMAANNATRLESVVKIEHRTTAPPPDAPVTLRLDPTVTRKTDQTEAEVVVIVDNRRGTRDRHLRFAGRDPAGHVRFGFDQQQTYVRAGEQAQLRVTISAPLPQPGQQRERPFSVTCTDGVVESVVTGTFGILSSGAPTQFQQGTPQHVDNASAPTHSAVDTSSPGDPAADVDTTRGPKRALRVALTVFGGLLVIVGAIRPWCSGGPTYAVSGLWQLPQVIGLTPLDDAERVAKLQQLTQPGARALVLILAVAIVLGIVATSGRYTLVAGLLAAVTISGYLGYAMVALGCTGPAYGAILVLAGGLIGAVGGLLSKRRAPS